MPHGRPPGHPLSQFNITKLQLIEAEKQKVKREYERKEGTIEVKKKARALGPPGLTGPRCYHPPNLTIP
jgi:hypothetical protein